MSTKEVKEAYGVLQAACGIEVGDKVKVVRKFVGYEIGWGSCHDWNSTSNKEGMQDGVYKVSSVTCRNYIIVAHSTEYNYEFPFFALELVEKAEKAKPDNMIDIHGKKWSEDTIAEALKKHADWS